MKRSWIGVFAAVVALGLAGCQSTDKNTEALTGKRIPILAPGEQLVPDPEAAKAGVRVPPRQTIPAWTQAGGTTTNVIGNINAPLNFNAAWSASVGDGVSNSHPLMATPLVVDGRVFTMDPYHTVSAFDLASGKRLWRVDLAEDEEDDETVIGGLAFEGGRLIATTGFGKVIALDAATGLEVWRVRVDTAMFTPPTIRAGRVFVVTGSNALYGLSMADGSELWPPYRGLPGGLSLLGGANPAVHGDAVVAPFASGEVTAMRVDNGLVLWADSLASRRRMDEISSIPHIYARPVVTESRVYALSYGGLLAAIDLQTGTRMWDREIGGFNTPWLAGNVLYVLNANAELACISTENGAVLWVTKLPALEDPTDTDSDRIMWVGPVMIDDELIALGSNGELKKISPVDGRITATVTLPTAVSTPPVSADNQLVIVDDDGTLSVYR